jgi:predicted aspartyl protease
MNCLPLLLAALLCTPALLADEQRRSSIPESETGMVVQASEDTRFGMIVKARVNGQDLRLMVDTGASFCFLSEAATKRLGLLPQEEIDAIAASGRRVGMKTGLVKRLELGSLVIENELVGINTALPEGFAGVIDGVLGLNCLKDFDVRFNHPERTLTFWKAGKAPRLEGEMELPLTALELSGRIQGQQAPSCLVEASIMGKPVPFLLDTGAVGKSVLVPQPLFSELFPDLAKTAGIKTFAGRDFAGVVAGSEVRLPEFKFAGETLKDFKVELLPSKDKYGILGQLLLNHYILTLDFQAKVLRAKSLGTVGELTQRSSIGLTLDLRGGDFFVGGMAPGGPCEKAGLKVGDKLLTVEGKEWKSLDDKAFYALVHLPPGTPIKVRYQRGNQPIVEVVMVLVKS